MTKIACTNGFLGAGKTTLMLRAAQVLKDRGLRVAIITNDQGRFLVDTARVRDSGFPVEEILGGCFCCRFSEFLGRAQAVVEQHCPDIILAEAVGSCTDLVRTVYTRLRQYPFQLAPLSVLVEPDRIREFTGLSTPFDDSVKYLFGQQLAEADHILMNKCDLLKPTEIVSLAEKVRSFAVDIPISAVSARTGDGVNQWVDQLLSEESRGRGLQVDYEMYGKAEASLGWLNATVDLTSPYAFSPNEIGEALVTQIQEFCTSTGCAIAHLKVMFVTFEGSDCIALTNSGGVGTWEKARRLPLAAEASLIMNARINIRPEKLRPIVEDSLMLVSSERAVQHKVQDLECFCPPPPERDWSIPDLPSAR